MKLTIVYDNEVFRSGVDLKSDWGFACFIETTKKENILFDTGAKGKILLENMQNLKINPEKIDKIVISHEHWDHNGGLEPLLDLLDKKVEVYRLEEPKKTDVTTNIVTESQKISSGIYTTGRLQGSPVDEQSLVLKGKKGWYVLTGCSHPGVEKILRKANQIGDIVGLIGGFHGFNNFSVLKHLELIYPCHCTKYKQEIRKKFAKSSQNCGVGKIIELDVID